MNKIFIIYLLISFLIVSCATIEAEVACDCIQQGIITDTCLANAEKAINQFDEAEKQEFRETFKQCLKDALPVKTTEQ